MGNIVEWENSLANRVRNILENFLETTNMDEAVAITPTMKNLKVSSKMISQLKENTI